MKTRRRKSISGRIKFVHLLEGRSQQPKFLQRTPFSALTIGHVQDQDDPKKFLAQNHHSFQTKIIKLPVKSNTLISALLFFSSSSFVDFFQKIGSQCHFYLLKKFSRTPFFLSRNCLRNKTFHEDSLFFPKMIIIILLSNCDYMTV